MIDGREDVTFEESEFLADETLSLVVSGLSSSIRIDRYLSESLPEYSRTYLKDLMENGRVEVSGKPVKPSFKVKNGDFVVLFIPPLKELEVVAEKIPLNIVYEDEDILIINKPKNMVVHPAPGNPNGTLVNGLLFYLKDRLSGINGVLRPGIVHRIDKDTTGILVVCKNDASHRKIALQLKEHSITRKYTALVNGLLKEDGVIDAPIGRHPTHRKKMTIQTKNGKRAVTRYKVLETYRLKNGTSYTLVECSLETGRTHQIRVHLSSISHSLVGDNVYGNGKNPFHIEGQALHAKTLGFVHPTTNQYIEFEAPLPDYFEQLLKKLDTLRI